MAVSEDRIDRRFALIATNGDVLYPTLKAQRRTGRFGFALSAPGEQDRHGGGVYTTDIKEVVRRVVVDGWNVRVTTSGRPKRERTGSLGIGKQAVQRYWLDPRLHGVVAGAAVRPESNSP